MHASKLQARQVNAAVALARLGSHTRGSQAKYMLRKVPLCAIMGVEPFEDCRLAV